MNPEHLVFLLECLVRYCVLITRVFAVLLVFVGVVFVLDGQWLRGAGDIVLGLLAFYGVESFRRRMDTWM